MAKLSGEIPEHIMEFLDENLHDYRSPYADNENHTNFLPNGYVGGVTDP